MRTLYITTFLCLAFLLKAQEIELVTITTNDRLFKGSIDGKYEITMYLEVVNSSPNSGYIESVQGWYYYDNVRTPIPLAGIAVGDLHLFTSSDKEVLTSLLDFEYQNGEETVRIDSHLFEVEDNLQKVQNVTERFFISVEENRISGQWFSGDKELDVQLLGNNVRLSSEKNYLKLPNGEFFDLKNMGLSETTDFELLKSANGGKRALLSYTYPANLNYGGRCGGAEDQGMFSLTFNDDYGVADITFAMFSSCYIDAYIDEEKEISDTITEYTITGPDEDVVYRVDFAKATITKK